MTLDLQKNMESAEEDMAFYAQVTRQILLLMDEDDHEMQSHAKGNRKGEAELRAVVCGGGASGNYNLSWSELGSGVPGWMERLWGSKGTGTGTGVFIPRVVASAKSRRRRRTKPKPTRI